jgi:hypothetical protein
MSHKLIKDIDEETWRRFVAYCKLKGAKVGDELGGLLDKHLEKHLKKILGR